MPWKLWHICSQFCRPFDGMGGAVLPLSASDALLVCSGYGETDRTFERILMIEQILYPIISKKKETAEGEEE